MMMLHNAWDEAYDKWVIQNIWNKKQVECYFKVLTINDATTTGFVEQCRRCQLAITFRNDPTSIEDEQLQLDFVERSLHFPLEYVKPLPPPMWS